MTLVVGATGALGFEICRRLRGRGVAVRALVRGASPRADRLADLGVETIAGDLKTPATIAHACRGIFRVISTASAMSSRRRGDTLAKVDLSGHLELVRAARAAGVGHVVYTSLWSEAHPRAPLVRCKRRVERAVRESGMAWTILQPARLMERAFSAQAGWDVRRDRVRLVGPGTTRFNPVSLADVAEFAALAATRADLERRVIPVGGPDALTALDVVGMFEEALGRPIRVHHTAVAAARLAARILSPVRPKAASRLALAAPTGHDDVVDMSLVLAEVPVDLTPLRSVVERIAAAPNPEN